MSGGADSVALLLGLRSLAREFGLLVHAAHLHHGLRGAEADGDLAFVRGLCARLGVPLHAARWDCRARMRRRGLSGEAGLRTLRREFLARAARRANAAAIATAHTADDQLETLLMRLLRGAGLTGLGGMRPRRGPWLKPLLEATRSEVEADLRARGQDWREDGSNSDPGYLRNRIRHRVVPALLAAADPRAQAPAGRARSALARRAARAAAECRAAAALIERRIARDLPRLSRIQSGEIALDSRRVASYPLASRRMLLRRAWALAARGESGGKAVAGSGLRGATKRGSSPGPGNGPDGLTHRHLEALSRLFESPRGGARLHLPGGFTAERDSRWVRLRRTGAGKPEPASGFEPVGRAAPRPLRREAQVAARRVR